MKIKYRWVYYQLPLREKIRYDKRKTYLLYKKVKRFLGRIISENIKLMGVLVILIICMTILIPIGIKLKKYSSVIDGIWDFKGTILTSVIVSLCLNTATIERQRHRNLIKQYQVYYSLEMYIEDFINEILKNIGLCSCNSIFIDYENLEYFEEQIKNIKIENLESKSIIEIKNNIIDAANQCKFNTQQEINKINLGEVIGLTVEEQKRNYEIFLRKNI